MTTIPIAVVGAGRLGGFHAQKLADIGGVELVGVADPLDEARNRVALQCNTRPYSDHRELLNRVEAVVIAAPTRLHHALGLDFLRRGIHVLMEKPLAACRAEADDLVDAAADHGAILQVGHVERFNPAFTHTVGHVRRAKFIEAVRASGYTFRSTDIGVVLDLMIHDLDLILTMVEGHVVKVDALGLSVLGRHEDVANARIQFSCGAVASLSASRVSSTPTRKMSIWAPQAFAAIDFADRTTTLVHPSRDLVERRFHVDRLSAAEIQHYKTHLVDEHLPVTERRFDAVDALALELADFVRSIQRAQSPRVPGEHGRDAVSLAEMILARISSHAWDGLPTGPVGPMATPPQTAIPAPHWDHRPAYTPRSPRAA